MLPIVASHRSCLDGWNVFNFTIVALSLLPAAGPFATVAVSRGCTSGQVVHERTRADLVVVRAVLEESVAGLDRPLLAGVSDDACEDVLRATLRRGQPDVPARPAAR